MLAQAALTFNLLDLTNNSRRGRMILYPVLLNLRGARCLIVGGGEVARRKIEHLLEAGARVSVVAPKLHPEITGWAKRGKVSVKKSEYSPRFVGENTRLIFACTNREEINRRVADDARARGIPCNRADDPKASDFHVPSMVRRGDLLLTVSTGGAAPMLARQICHGLEQTFGPSWGEFTALLGEIRREWLEQGLSGELHDRMNAVLRSDALQILESRGLKAARRRIDRLFPTVPQTRASRKAPMRRSRRSA
jgi:precorrin-2 dehydrogenase/sirohydrochlorin ferrochelatase